MTQASDIDLALDLAADVPALTLDPVFWIHRHDDGRIALVRKTGGEMEQLFSLTLSDLRGETMFRTIAEYLFKDSYFSLQAFKNPAPAGWVHKGTGLPAIGKDKRKPGERRFGRVTENLRYLNCLSCDIDCGRPLSEAKNDLEKMPWRDAQRRVENLQDAGAIPPFSIMGFSGRGLYVIWLLNSDKDRHLSAPAYFHDIPRWKALQKELVRRLDTAQLPVDPQGSMITQVYRFDGSINSKSQKRVEYFLYAQGGPDKRLISYTMHEMEEALDLHLLDGDLPEATEKLARPAQYRRTPVTRNPNKAHGYKKRYALLAHDLLAIEKWRGGFLKCGTVYLDGHRSPKYGRRMILTLYAQALVRSMYSPKELMPPATMGPGMREDVLSRLLTMARQCKPPYPSDPNDTAPEVILDAVLREYKPGSDGKQRIALLPSNATLCAALGVTAEAAREHDLQTIRPLTVALEADQARPLQADLVKARREFVRQYIEAHGVIPARRLARVLHAAGYIGSPDNQQTPNQDLNALGYHVTRSPGGRPRKALRVGK